MVTGRFGYLTTPLVLVTLNLAHGAVCLFSTQEGQLQALITSGLGMFTYKRTLMFAECKVGQQGDESLGPPGSPKQSGG